MTDHVLTAFDNTYLSKTGALAVVEHEPNRAHDLLDAQVERYLRASVAENTRRAYRSDVVDFLKWGGTIPSTPEAVARYLGERATSLSPYTLERRLVAITRAHHAVNADSPCSHRLVHATLKGIRRVKGVQQRRVSPLAVEELQRILDVIPNGLRGTRDHAMLLVGFAGAFRRSELVAIDVDDVQFVTEGMVICVPRSKTDQECVGRRVAIPHGRTALCPVAAIREWVRVASVVQGKVFRNVDSAKRVSEKAITATSVALIIKRYARIAELDATKFSGHSLRAGLVTSAARAGVSLWKIRQQTGHCSDLMVQRYIREANLFAGNAAQGLL